MKNDLTDEELEDLRKRFPDNTAAHIKRVRHLLKHAKPGNIPWRILENTYGFTGDYINGQDDGEPPHGAKW